MPYSPTHTLVFVVLGVDRNHTERRNDNMIDVGAGPAYRNGMQNVPAVLCGHRFSGRPGVRAAGLGQLTFADASLAPMNEVDPNVTEPSAPAVKWEANRNGALDPARRRLVNRVARRPPAAAVTAETRAVSVPFPRALLSTA
jgi:hypothetical protein